MDREKKTTNIFERTNKKTDKQRYKRKPTTSNPTMTGKEQLHRRKGKKRKKTSQKVHLYRWDAAFNPTDQNDFG